MKTGKINFAPDYKSDQPQLVTTLIPHETVGTTLNKLAVEIAKINKDHGFYEPVPKSVGSAAQMILEWIAFYTDLLENLRKEPFEEGSDTISSIELEFRQLKLALIISEVIEIYRSTDKSHHDEEVADVLIRLLDYVDATHVDIDKEVAAKVEKNRNRPYKHGKSF